MEKESLSGVTAALTTGNMSTTKNKAMVSSHGLPVKNTMANGLTISNMVKDIISHEMERRGLLNGSMVEESSG